MRLSIRPCTSLFNEDQILRALFDTVASPYALRGVTLIFLSQVSGFQQFYRHVKSHVHHIPAEAQQKINLVCLHCVNYIVAMPTRNILSHELQAEIAKLDANGLTAVIALAKARLKSVQPTKLTPAECSILRALNQLLVVKGYRSEDEVDNYNVRILGVKVREFKKACSNILSYEKRLNIPSRSLQRWRHILVACVYSRESLSYNISHNNRPSIKQLVVALNYPYSAVDACFPGYTKGQLINLVANFKEVEE